MSGLLLPCTLTDEKGGRIVPARGKVFFGFFTESWGGAAWGRVCGRAKLLAGTLRCLRLLLTSSFELSDRPTVGALPQTPQGTLSLDPARGRRKGTKSPLDPFSRLSWSHFHAPSACSFLWLRLSPCLLPQLSAKNPFLSVSVRPQKPFHHAPIERVAAAVQQEKQQQRI